MHAQRGEPTGRPNKQWWWWGGGLALLLLASGAGVFRGFSPEKVDRGEALRRAAIGGLVGLMLAGLLIGAWAWRRKRTGVAAGALGASLLAALIAFLVAALATLGASTASPTTSSQPGQSSEENDEGADGDAGENGSVDPNGGVLDARTGKVYVDTDGDGVVDTELIDCPVRPSPTLAPDSTETLPPPTTLPPYRVGDKVRVLIDNECDGIIDDIIYVDVRERVKLGTESATSTTTGDSSGNSDDQGDDDSGSSSFGTIFLIVLIIAAIVGVGFAVRSFLRNQRAATAKPLPPPLPTTDDPEIDTEAAADSLAQSGRIVVDDPDPRRAIVAAYGALLAGLEAAGAGRRPFEAPEEHLQRSMRHLHVPPDALAEVTRLFLVAKFSSHPLGEPERQQARSALGEAERHLRSLIEARAAEQG